MKVGLVSPYDWSHPGGVSDHIRHLGGQLRGLGHEVRVLAPSARKDVKEPGVYRIGGVVSVPVNDSVARITLSLNLARQVEDILERERFDVLHLHEPFMPALPLTVLRLSRTANVGTFHAFARSNLGYYYGRPFFASYLRRLQETIAVSRPAREFVRQYFPQADPRIVPNGVDTETFRPGHSPIRHLRDDMFNVLFLGRLEKRKGLNDLLLGFRHLQLRHPRSRLIIVGDGPLRSRVEHGVARLRLENVVLAGYVPESVKPRYYASADVACFPATGGESFGVVILEAMASGLPVVATEVPGYLSVVEAGKDSITVRPRTPVELGAALTVLARDAALRERLGAAALQKARHYAWRDVAVRVIEVYQSARAQLAESEDSKQHVHDAVSGLGSA
ncbi:MAG TPA: glycosyltransferase family 4 protein [Candidatus Dormibacteraeota bacterium]